MVLDARQRRVAVLRRALEPRALEPRALEPRALERSEEVKVSNVRRDVTTATGI